MAHNFRLTGNKYVSKAGSDSNDGNTKDTPIPSLVKAYSLGLRLGQIIAGAGTYYWPDGLGANSIDEPQTGVSADGYVKILGNGATMQRLAGAQATFLDIYFDQFAGFEFRSYQYGNGVNYYRCVFKVLPSFASTTNSLAGNAPITFEDSIFFNINLAQAAGCTFTKCLFLNCVIQDAASVSYCYIDGSSAITTASATKNNVDPRCNPNLSQGIQVGAGGFGLTSPQGITALPGFNSLAKEDFSLRKDSPHVTTGIGPSNLRYANTYFFDFTGGSGELVTIQNSRLKSAASSAIVPLASATDGGNALEVNGQGGMVLKPSSLGDGTGTIVSGRIPFSDIPLEMTVMNLIAGLNFNSSFPASEGQINLNQPEVYNNNVPDFSNSQAGSAGRNPNRLTYRMRWSTKLDPDINNAEDWVSGATFIEFEWNTKPLWQQAALQGNGDPAFNAAGATAIIARWIQVQVRLRNNYFR